MPAAGVLFTATMIADYVIGRWNFYLKFQGAAIEGDDERRSIHTKLDSLA